MVNQVKSKNTLIIDLVGPEWLLKVHSDNSKVGGEFYTKKCESSKETVKLYALACVILHNICILREENLSPQLDLTLDPATFHQRDRNKIRETLQMRSCSKVKDTSRKATLIRNNIVELLWKEKKNVT